MVAGFVECCSFILFLFIILFSIFFLETTKNAFLCLAALDRALRDETSTVEPTPEGAKVGWRLTQAPSP